MGGFGAAAQHGGIALDPVIPFGVVGPVDGRRRAQDAPIRSLGQIRQACGFVDRISDYRVFITVFGADVAGEDSARRHPDTEIHGEAPQLGPQRARRGKCRR